MKKNLMLAFLIVLFYCGGKEQKTAVQKTEEKPQITESVLMVIAPKDFRDEEFKEPFDLFTKSGITVTIASTDTTPAKGMLGMIVKPGITIEQVNPDSFNALVVVGGTGCQVLWDNTTLHKIVQNFHRAKKTIAAICIAPVVLARAGILKETKATVYASVKDDLTSCGAQYTGADIEVSGNIITASGPQAAKEFSQAILNKLKQ